MPKPRICIIGAGPSGMSTLYHFAKMEQMPEVVCYEKQSTWGGLWNVSWKTVMLSDEWQKYVEHVITMEKKYRAIDIATKEDPYPFGVCLYDSENDTGDDSETDTASLDENGEPVHSSMYKHMWCNGPKELYEYPDYTFEMHFGQPTPSFPSRIVLRDYLEGRYTRGAPRGRNLKDFIHFNTAVRYVKYLDEKDEFIVTVNDYNNGQTREETFSHVVVANGIFNTPNLPDFPGMNEFKGRILHSHDFRDARDFTGQRVLIVGAGYTGEDLVLQCIKFDAKSVILAYRTRPKGATCIMPNGVEEKPMVERFDSKKAYFKDGSSAEIDSIILTTGYRNYFPFLEDRFRIPEVTHVYPEGLYKASLFYKAGNKRLFYVGVQVQINTLTYFEVIANWTCKFIVGELEAEPKDDKQMEVDSNEWHKRANACASEADVVMFQTALIDHLAELGGYNRIVAKNKDGLLEWIRARKEVFGLANYRDNTYRSLYTGLVSPKQTPFMQNYDDSIEAYLKCT